MAKTAAMLKSHKVKLDKGQAAFLATLNGSYDGEDAREEWENFVKVTEAHESLWKRNESLADSWDAKPGDAKLRAAFMASCIELERSAKAWFGAYDKFMLAVKRATEPMQVSEDELFTIIRDSLQGNTDGVQFDMNIGLLARQVMLTLRPVAAEDDTLDAPYCGECLG